MTVLAATMAAAAVFIGSTRPTGLRLAERVSRYLTVVTPNRSAALARPPLAAAGLDWSSSEVSARRHGPLPLAQSSACFWPKATSSSTVPADLAPSSRLLVRSPGFWDSGCLFRIAPRSGSVNSKRSCLWLRTCLRFESWREMVS